MKYKQRAMTTGMTCPYCNRGYIEGDSVPTLDENMIYNDVYCTLEECGKEWTEVYTMTDITERSK